MHEVRVVVAVAFLFSIACASQPVATPPGANALDGVRTLVAEGRNGEAAVALRRIVKNEPANARAHNMLGALLNTMGHYAEALPHTQAAVLLEPENARFRYTRGVVLSEHGRFGEAVADFDQALAAQPELTYAWLERGAARWSLGDIPGAREDWRRAAEVDPKLIWPVWYQASGDFAERKFAEAAAGFEKVATAQPDFTPAKLWSGVARGRAGNRVPAFSQAAASDWPAPVIAFYNGAITRRELLRVAANDRVSGDRRRVAEAHFFLAQQAVITGDETTAVRELRAALAVPSPRHVWRISAEEELARLEADGAR